MHKFNRITIWLLVSLTIVYGVAGCARDPIVRRQNFLASGQKYFDKGQFDAANIQFQRAVQVDPKFAEGYYRIALASLQLGRWQEAYRALQHAVLLDGKHVAAQTELAKFEIAARQNEQARKTLNDAIAADPTNAAPHLLLGRIELSEKQFQKALDEFALAEQLSPKDPQGYTQAGDTLLLQKRYAEAIQNFRRAIDVDSASIPAYLDLALLYRLQSDTKMELSTLEDAIKHDPKAIPPYLAAASVHVRQGEPSQLPELFRKLRQATADSPVALLAIGDFYFRAGDSQDAKRTLLEAIAKDGKNNVIRRRLIEVHLSQQEWSEAESLNAELLKSEPKDPPGRLFQARLEFVHGSKAKSVSLLEQLVHDVPEMTLPHFYLGLAYADQGQIGRAIGALNDSLQQEPDFIWAYVSLGELHNQQGSPKLALEFAKKALSRNPTFSPALLLQVNANLQLNNDASAAAQLQSMAQAQPKNPGVLERLGFALMKQKQYAEAEKTFEDCLRLQPDFVPGLVDLARLYELQHRSDEIVGRIKRQIAVAPKQASFYEILGAAYMAKGDESQAQQAFLDALSQDQNASIARIQLARIYASQKKFPQAIEIANKALQGNPSFLPGYLLLGSLYEQTGSIKQAEDVYERVLEKNPTFGPALNNLAWLYSEHEGNLDLALTLAVRAKENLPKDPSVSDTLAWIQYRKGLYSSATTSLRDLTRVSPENAVYQYHLGMALLKVGKGREAKLALQRALGLNPSFNYAPQARTALAQLEGKEL